MRSSDIVDNRAILISGGSRGLGRAMALSAAEKGYTVLITYCNNKSEAEQTIAQARQLRADATVHAYKLDVSDVIAVEKLCDHLIEEYTQIHGVVNNAGILKNNAMALMSNEEWDEVIATNLSGAFYLSRALLMHFISNRFGRIVNVSSLAAYGSAGQANYSASKAGLIGMSLAMAREYGPKNITTNVVVPGLVETDMMREHLSKELRGMWEKHSPLRRMPIAQEIADAVLFLMSDAASSINGETIHVTGGFNCVP